jgi:hypothetical protein
VHHPMTERWRPGQRPTEGGVPPPLLALPLFPSLPGYRDFDDQVRQLGFRHAVDVLHPTGNAAVFRVVDGLWFPGPGRLWERVDAERCRAAGEAWRGSGEQRAAGAAALADRLAEVAEQDPVALRRLVLFQVCCRLRDAPGVDEAAAVALGVHDAEARPLAEAVAAHFPGPGQAREAAGEITDALRGNRLRHAARLAERLPAPPDDAPHADTFLTGLREEIAAAGEAVARRLAEARELRERGEHRAAATACLALHRQAVDEESIREELLKAAAGAAEAEKETGAAPAVVAIEESGAVRVSWTAAAAAVPDLRYQVLRFPDGSPKDAVQIAMETGTTVRDTDPPAATQLRYAVIPWRGARCAGIAKAAGPVLLLPDPERLHARAVPDGVWLTWRSHPVAHQARVARVVAGQETEVPCEREALTDRPLPAGDYHYLVRSGYPGPDGDTLWSAGRLAVARAEEWPTPVDELHVRRLPGNDGRVELSWSRPARGESRLMPWPGGPPPRPGEDVSELSARGGLTANDGEPTPRVTIAPPPRAVTRLTAVSVLGDRAVAGPTVLLDIPGTTEDLQVRRLDTKRAEVRFRWPEPAILALLTWQNGERGEQYRLARSQHPGGSGRVEIPVSRGEHVITLTPVARPDAALAECGTAQVRLPALPLPRVVLTGAVRAAGAAKSIIGSWVRRPGAAPRPGRR